VTQQEPLVFISWSGERSRKPAEAFRTWLQAKVPRSRPFISSVDIPQLGSREWREEIFSALESCKVFLSFVTTDNRDARWLLFEAGAAVAAMRRRQIKIALILLDLKAGDLTEPLVAYMQTNFDHPSMRKLVLEINDAIGDGGYGQNVGDSFDVDWKALELMMKPSPLADKNTPKHRDQDDKIDEILDKVRSLEAAKPPFPPIRALSQAEVHSSPEDRTVNARISDTNELFVVEFATIRDAVIFKQGQHTMLPSVQTPVIHRQWPIKLMTACGEKTTRPNFVPTGGVAPADLHLSSYTTCQKAGCFGL
jgi:hypothetical protein